MYVVLIGPPRGSTKDLHMLAGSLGDPALTNDKDQRGPERLSDGAWE